MLKNKTGRNQYKSIAMAVAIAVSPLIAAPANAAGLGRISVLSALGEPLRAQLEVTGSRDELASLSARLASQEAFRAAGIEYGAVLTQLKFSARPKFEGNRQYIEITTERPLNEPFVDMLVELNWASGRLVREYTFLLDPPEMMAQRQPVVPAAQSAPATETPAAKPREMPREAAPSAPAGERPTAKLAPKAAPAAESEQTHLVKSGETLGSIAKQVRGDGVSVEQMLVALFRSNPDAFDGNMNRMRAGKILRVPDAEAAKEVDVAAAKKEVRTQFADFEAYRNRLAERAAASPAKAVPTEKSAAGRIVPKVEDKPASGAAGGDKLAVSKSESAAVDGKLKGRLGALEEDLVARDRSLKEANSRIADLEKNLTDLKKLAELKSQAGAAAQKNAEAAKPAPAAEKPAAKAPEAPKATAPVEVKPEVKAEVKADAKPAGEPPKAEAPKPADAAPSPAPAKKVVPPPPEPEEPDFMEEFGSMIYAGAAALLALVGGLGFLAWKRKKAQSADEAPASVAMTQSSLAATSVFGESLAANSIPASSTEPQDLSITETQTQSPDESIDPIVEADTYLAFGKDAQAEEILLEALKTEPARLAVHVKLLEIYSSRRAGMQYQTLAAELKSLTGGEGPEWQRAVEMGSALDPANPLYKPTSAAAVAAGQTVILDAPVEAVTADVAATAAPAPAAAEEVAALDFDLGLGAGDTKASAESQTEQVAALDFDLDLGTPDSAAETEVVEAAKPVSLDIDFDLELPVTPVAQTDEAPATTGLSLDNAEHEVAALALEVPSVEPSEASEPSPVAEVAALELTLPDVAPAVEPPPAVSTPEAPSIDFDFDLGDNAAVAATSEPVAAVDVPLAPAGEGQPVDSVGPTSTDDGVENPEAATKLELALAYEEMGDREGARELLQEVLAEGSASQQAKARSKLDQLA